MKTVFTTVAFEFHDKGEGDHDYWGCMPPGKIDYHNYGYISWSDSWQEYVFEPNENIALSLVTMSEIVQFLGGIAAQIAKDAKQMEVADA